MSALTINRGICLLTKCLILNKYDITSLAVSKY